ncbi:O-antigen polymerase [Exiguobacterium acetylicum]|uniref:O-antigen polymerase n=1 Tax=Exiguobacterium acetylicum TaxID=41170 RepID=UPI0034D45147
MNDLLIILLIWFSIVISLVIRKIQGSWFAPGAFFSLYWTINIIVLILSLNIFIIHWEGILIIVLFIIIFSVGSTIGMHSIKKNTNVNITESKNYFSFLNKFSTTITLIGFISFPAILFSSGASFIDLLSIDSIIDLAQANSSSRYSGELDNTFSVSILLSFNYFAAILNGIIFGSSLNKNNFKKIILFVPIIVSILIAMILTTKATILFTTILFLGGYISVTESKDKIIKLFTFKKMLGFIILIPSIFCIFAFIQMGRYGFRDLNGFLIVIDLLKIWSFGHIPAFSIWINHDFFSNINIDLGFGSKTFAGLYDILGISKRVSGGYSYGVIVSENGFGTNVFTAFRGLIEDFGIIGAVGVLMFVALFTGRMYKKSKENGYLHIPLLSCFYSFILFSFATSIFAYNSIILAYCLLLFLTFIYYFIYKKKN